MKFSCVFVIIISLYNPICCETSTKMQSLSLSHSRSFVSKTVVKSSIYHSFIQLTIHALALNARRSTTVRRHFQLIIFIEWTDLCRCDVVLGNCLQRDEKKKKHLVYLFVQLIEFNAQMKFMRKTELFGEIQTNLNESQTNIDTKFDSIKTW